MYPIVMLPRRRRPDENERTSHKAEIAPSAAILIPLPRPALFLEQEQHHILLVLLFAELNHIQLNLEDTLLTEHLDIHGNMLDTGLVTTQLDYLKSKIVL